ncbi:pilin [Vibrio algivorus]|uniref:Pilin n=1 Tax=Vibrio algivorus TaxID=1667024 RepID=A0A557P481_9VIBR|nr:pilin [Vibrio algivorus]TVO35475.1 pilin [Vibrio algivorus]
MKQLQQGKKKLQKGFTLIELMIVVAVIGVLAAIAMPQYQKYIAKSEVASALATLTGAKTNVEAFAVSNGEFPDGSTAGQTATDLGIPEMPLSVSSGVALTPASGAAGSIVFTFADVPKASALAANQNLTLTRSSSGAWTCTSTNISNSDGILPKNCTGQ